MKNRTKEVSKSAEQPTAPAALPQAQLPSRTTARQRRLLGNKGTVPGGEKNTIWLIVSYGSISEYVFIAFFCSPYILLLPFALNRSCAVIPRNV